MVVATVVIRRFGPKRPCPTSIGSWLRLRSEEAEFDRLLATALFTDIVGSTEKPAPRPGGARGVHTGEIELEGDEVRGIAVHIGARVAALAAPSEVLVSRRVKDLVAGSGLTFEDAGDHELKGVPDRWHLYRALSELA